MTMPDLKNYINENISEDETSYFYEESFCNIVFDYLGSMGEFSKADKQFLKENGYDEDDFIQA